MAVALLLGRIRGARRLEVSLTKSQKISFSECGGFPRVFSRY